MSCSPVEFEISKRVIPHVYLPNTEYCTDHSNLFLLEDEKLVKPGDKFESHDAFIQYLNENAKRWFFYYKCSDSRKPNTDNESYTYNCVYLRNKEKYKKKGIRKRNNNMKTDCPCKIKLRHLPNEKELTVVYVCNHHDHELSLEQFCKLQHGRRLPPYIREEILDFLALQVDKGKIKKYVEMETGFNMSRPFFYALEKNLQKGKHIERQITEQRLQLLQEKIAAVEDVCDSENSGQNEESQEYSETPRRPNPRKATKNPEHIGKYAQAKRRSKTADEVSSSEYAKKIKIEPQVTYTETIQSVRELQESVKCETQENPWVTDQCVPVLPNRSTLTEELQELNQDPNYENISYQIEYYNPDSTNTHEIVYNDFHEIVNDGQGEVEGTHENDIDNIAYETVVTDDNNVINEMQDYVIDNEQSGETSENIMYFDDSQMHEASEVNQFDSGQGIEVGQVQYIADDAEHFVEYIPTDEENVHDVGVQTITNMESGHTLLPVFDVYMKDGNVTGFVVNDNIINGLKDGVDKCIQTSEDIIYSDIQEIENEDYEIIQDSADGTGDVYTKHEYVHRYNIDQYMTQPNFPKYVDILAKETCENVLNMFTNVYNEKAMFKLTTTQKGKEGNTRIRYITHNGRIKKKRNHDDELKRERFGRKLQSAFILKEKLRFMKKENEELLKRNEQLEDIALRFIN
ncbi:uncharacterized protein LOC142984520 isoform X2 [Anticarsia gemmatalis]